MSSSTASTLIRRKAMSVVPSVADSYVFAVVAAGTLLLANGVLALRVDQPLLLLLLAGASVLVSAPFFRVTMPLERRESTMSLAYTVDLVAIALLGPTQAALVGAAGTWSQCYFGTRGRTPWHRTLFSIAAVVLSTYGAAVAYTQIGGVVGSTSPQHTFLPLLAASTALFLLNSGLVAAAISLARDEPLWRVWHSNFLWSAPGYFAGGTIALAALTVVGLAGFWPVPLLAFPVYLTMRSYQIYLGRLDAEREQLEAEQRHVRQLSDMHLATVEALARAIEAKEQSPHSHIRRIQTYAVELARAAGMSEQEVQGVATAALLHDIGKLGIPEYILAKAGPLTAAEVQKLRQHPELGAAIVADVPFPYPVTPFILSHHERWDGSGYPHGLAGERIPQGGRVLAVADYFDALTSERCYRERFRWDEAVAIIRHEAGRALDPALVERFVELLPTLPQVIETPEVPKLAGPLPTRVQAVFSNIAQAHEEVRALNEISKAVASSLRLDDVVAAFVPRLQPLVPFAACALLLPDGSSDAWRCRAADGVDADDLRDAALRTTDPSFQRVVQQQRVEGQTAVAALFERGSRAPLNFVSCTLAPLTMVDRSIGALALFHTDATEVADDHLRLLERVCEHMAPAIQNAVLFERTREDSLTDALTDLPNARALVTRAMSELAHAGQQRTELTVLLVDIDAFKTINDTHGHRTGDRALCAVSRAIESVLTSRDFAARYAGDEFVVLLAGVSESEAAHRVSQLTRAVSESRIEVAAEAARLSVSVSVGAASYGSDGVTLEALLGVADQRMYAEKARSWHVERRMAIATER